MDGFGVRNGYDLRILVLIWRTCTAVSKCCGCTEAAHIVEGLVVVVGEVIGRLS